MSATITVKTEAVRQRLVLARSTPPCLTTAANSQRHPFPCTVAIRPLDRDAISAPQRLALLGSSPRLSLATLTFFRCLTLAWLLAAGIGVGWTMDATWLHGNPPPVFLTEWGFIALCTYFACAVFASLALRMRRKNLGASTSALLGLGPTRRLAVFLFVSQVAFEVALTIEPLIVLGFWLLVFPRDHDCAFPSCFTVHGIGALCLIMDASVNYLTFHWRHLTYVLLYTSVWLLSQLWWVYSGHEPDYEVLTMRDMQSLYLILIGFVAQAAFFTALKRALDFKFS